MSEQLFQIGIKAVIRNERGEVLLCSIPYPQEAVFWDLPGGRMDQGEDFMQALRRELKEELGIEYDGEPKLVMPVLSNFTISVGNTEVALAMIVYEVALPDSVVPRATEADSTIEWVTPTQAAERLGTKFPPEFCEHIAAL